MSADDSAVISVDDNIVVLRAASRVQPQRKEGNISFSLSKGVTLDTNVAKRLLERLRKALNWEVMPVISDFDEGFNQNKPLFFEKLYTPFIRGFQAIKDPTAID